MTYLLFAFTIVVSALIIDMVVLKTWVIREKTTWMILAIMMILTLIFDYLLVSLPIVTYSPDAISGLSLFSIPIEDFSYTIVTVVISLSLQKYLRQNDERN